MHLFLVPYFYPAAYAPGLQVSSPGQGGPSGNPAARLALPQSWPGMSGTISGLSQFPNYVQAYPQMPVANQWNTNPNGTTVPGWIKKPTYE